MPLIIKDKTVGYDVAHIGIVKLKFVGLVRGLGIIIVG